MGSKGYNLSLGDLVFWNKDLIDSAGSLTAVKHYSRIDMRIKDRLGLIVGFSGLTNCLVYFSPEDFIVLQAAHLEVISRKEDNAI